MMSPAWLVQTLDAQSPDFITNTGHLPNSASEGFIYTVIGMEKARISKQSLLQKKQTKLRR